MTDNVIYFDFNATYPPNNDTIIEMAKWAKKGNISSNYTSADDGKILLDKFRKEISDLCEFSLNGTNGFTIIFTSGASESNSFIIQSICRAVLKIKRVKPHIITSSIEHDSILHCVKGLEEEYLQVSELGVHTSGEEFGRVKITNLQKLIKNNTCLVSIMASNNETGVVNDLKSIADISHGKNIPVHTDAVQLFAKEIFKPNNYGVDAFSVSFHKLGGPIGCGFLAIRNSLLDGHKIPPLIYGSQQNNMRGGTIPIHNLAAARFAFNSYFNNRDMKSIYVRGLRETLKQKLQEIYPIIYIDDYIRIKPPPPVIVLLSPKKHEYSMANTLLISIYKLDICNVELRKKLYDNRVIISIGSACKTGDKKISHVIRELEIPEELYPGIFRISFGDCNDEDEIDRFITKIKPLLYNV
jgi:cysteine desulfurase